MDEFIIGENEEGALVLTVELSQSWVKTFKQRRDESINNNGHSVLSISQELF